jgi:BolA family transcriptional regulator, general stress-responsive regulator
MEPIAARSSRVARIRERLTDAFAPTELEVIDESDRHKGHEGARDGRGHFRVKIVSSLFTGRTRIERHRMVFEALHSLIESDIHALGISTGAPEEKRQC